VLSANQQIYKVDANNKISQLTDAPNIRFADLVFNEADAVLIAVAEEHSADDSVAHSEPLNTLVAIDTSNGAIDTVHQGQDFYASPCLSADGSRLCWLSWMHPNMPWDGTSLWQADCQASKYVGAGTATVESGWRTLFCIR